MGYRTATPLVFLLLGGWSVDACAAAISVNSNLPPILVHINARARPDMHGPDEGVILYAINKMIESSHAASLRALQTLEEVGAQRERVRQAFACLGVEDVAQGCREVIFEEGPVNPIPPAWGPVPDEVVGRIRSHPAGRGYLLTVTELFDGRMFQYATVLLSADSAPSKGVNLGARYSVTYISPYSLKADQAASIGEPPELIKEAPPGSKAGYSRYWLDGEPSRLAEAIVAAPQSVGSIYAQLLAANPQPAFAADSSLGTLPKVGDVIGRGTSVCSHPYRKWTVVREAGDRLWIRVGQKDLTFLVTPRCYD